MKQDKSIVASGRYKGRLFADYLVEDRRENWAGSVSRLSVFPILVKLIDAKENLSVQCIRTMTMPFPVKMSTVKNEMWYVLEHEEGAGIYCGFKQDMTREQVQEALTDGSILSLLNWIPVEDGKAYYIPAGTVHAIGKGVVVCEIQQKFQLYLSSVRL